MPEKPVPHFHIHTQAEGEGRIALHLNYTGDTDLLVTVLDFGYMKDGKFVRLEQLLNADPLAAYQDVIFRAISDRERDGTTRVESLYPRTQVEPGIDYRLKIVWQDRERVIRDRLWPFKAHHEVGLPD